MSLQSIYLGCNRNTGYKDYQNIVKCVELPYEYVN